MWDNPTLKGFKLLKNCNKLRFYQNIENPKIILVGINFSSKEKNINEYLSEVLK